MDVLDNPDAWTFVPPTPRQTDPTTVIVKLTDGFDLTAITPAEFSLQLGEAAQLTRQERRDTFIEVRVPQNIVAVDTHRASAATKLLGLENINLQGKKHPVSAYQANHPRNARAILHGAPLTLSEATTREELVIQGRRIFLFRRLGRTHSLIITLEG